LTEGCYWFVDKISDTVQRPRISFSKSDWKPSSEPEAVNFLDYDIGGVGGTTYYCWFNKDDATVAFDPIGKEAVASRD